MTAPLDHYRDLIQAHNRTAPARDLPEPLASIAYLLACGNEANAAGLADDLARKDAVIEAVKELEQDLRSIIAGWRDHANGDYCRTYNKERGNALSDAADMIEGHLNAAALREGAG